MTISNISTDKWTLHGFTYRLQYAFCFVGDLNEAGTYELRFDTNGSPFTVAIPKPLKSLESVYDYCQNGSLVYYINDFIINHQQAIYFEDFWNNDDTTVCFYVPLPSDCKKSSKVRSSTLSTVYTNITASNTIGIKTIEQILAIRLDKVAVGIEQTTPRSEWQLIILNYLKQFPIHVLYELREPEIHTLKNCSFPLIAFDNQITCTNTYMPSHFIVEYPIEVIINTTIDIRQIQAIGSQVAKDKVAVYEMKLSLEASIGEMNQKYIEIVAIDASLSDLENKIKAIETDLNTKYESVLQNHNDVLAALEQIITLRQTVEQLKTQTETIYKDIQAIQSNLNNLLSTHNNATDAHPHLKNLITVLDKKVAQHIATVTAELEQHLKDYTVLNEKVTTCIADLSLLKTNFEDHVRTLNETLATINQKLNLLEVTLLNHSQLISNIQDSVNTLNTNVDNNTSSIVAINSSLETINHLLNTHVGILEAITLPTGLINVEAIPYANTKLQATNLKNALDEIINIIKPNA